VKRCIGCGETKTQNSFQFVNHATYPYRLNQCRACKAEYKRKHYLANRGKVLERQRRWRAANGEKKKATDRAYYHAYSQKPENKERRNAKNRHRYRHDPEYRKEVLERQRRHAEKDPDGYNAKRAGRTRRRRAVKANVESDGHTISELHADWLSRGIDPKVCYYCDHPISNWKTSVGDHVVPITRGGPDIVGNLVPCCSHVSKGKGNCQNLKGYRLLTEWTPPNMREAA